MEGGEFPGKCIYGLIEVYLRNIRAESRLIDGDKIMVLLTALKEFCKTGCDRFAFLIKYLQTAGIPYSILRISGFRHILVRYGDQIYSPEYMTRTFTAHYDRVPGTPGANDNSAAVFQLLLFAERLSKSRNVHNIQILFTDGEELPGGDRVENLGSYKLAEEFIREGISDTVFYVFDMCGIGDTIIRGTSGEDLLRLRGLTSMPVYTELRRIGDYTEAVLLSANRGRYLNIPVPFSDEIGFILNGFPAFQFSVLPWEEAVRYSIDSESGKTQGVRAGVRKPGNGDGSPAAWGQRHLITDTPEKLNESAFLAVATLLKAFMQFGVPSESLTTADVYD